MEIIKNSIGCCADCGKQSPVMVKFGEYRLGNVSHVCTDCLLEAKQLVTEAEKAILLNRISVLDEA